MLHLGRESRDRRQHVAWRDGERGAEQLLVLQVLKVLGLLPGLIGSKLMLLRMLLAEVLLLRMHRRCRLHWTPKNIALRFSVPRRH